MYSLAHEMAAITGTTSGIGLSIADFLRNTGSTETSAVLKIPDNAEITSTAGVNLPMDVEVSFAWERYDTIAPAQFNQGKWVEA